MRNLFAMDDIVNEKGTARKLSQLSNLEGRKTKRRNYLRNKIYLRLKLLSSKYSAFGGTSFWEKYRLVNRWDKGNEKPKARAAYKKKSNKQLHSPLDPDGHCKLTSSDAMFLPTLYN